VFSHRTSWPRQPNPLTELLEALRRDGRPIIDLTISNPTETGFTYPEKEILSSLANPLSLRYQPEPRGMLSARAAVSSYYRMHNVDVDPSAIFLTAGTSESYSLLFKLLCNPSDEVLVPRPSYPLFEYLAQINDVTLRSYRLQYDHEWSIDLESLRENITRSSRAIVLIHPHNPTGMFLKVDVYREIVRIAREKSLALITDEVFSEYGFEKDPGRVATTAGADEVLTFTLNGISKMLGLPQMKLGWMAVGGTKSAVMEASERLEILCDTFLSVNTPVQVALPQLLKLGEELRMQIRRRILSNWNALNAQFSPKTRNHPCSVLCAEGGWYGIIRMPRIKTDEEWALELLGMSNVHVQPGYFFDIEEEGFLVVSLLVDEDTFRDGIGRIIQYMVSGREPAQ